MAQEGPRQQRLHAALIRDAAFVGMLKYFPQDWAEMLQEIRVGDVDLGRDHP